MDIVGRFIDVFCIAAIEKADGRSESDSVLFERMKKSYLLLVNHPKGLKHFAQLLDHENNWIKVWVASQLLSNNGDKKAFAVLDTLSKEESIMGLCASTTLDEYKKGILRGPFSEIDVDS